MDTQNRKTIVISGMGRYRPTSNRPAPPQGHFTPRHQVGMSPPTVGNFKICSVTIVHNPISESKAKALGSLIGIRSNLQEVVVFQLHEGGKDTLHRAFLPEISLQETAQELDRLCIDFRAIIPADKQSDDPEDVPGHHIIVFNIDSDPEVYRKVEGLAEKYKSKAHASFGTGCRVNDGATTIDDAKRAYQGHVDEWRNGSEKAPVPACPAIG